MAPPLRVALVGAGIFAQDAYVPNLLAYRDRIRLTAILSRSPEPIETLLSALSGQEGEVARFSGADGEEQFFSQVCDLCDAVIIVVPIPLLGAYVSRCLALGLHILSEKPVAATSAEARRLIQLYRAQSHQTPTNGSKRLSTWHVAENYRTEPAIIHAAKLIQQKLPMTPKTFSLIALRQQSPTSKYAVTTWRANPTHTGSYVGDGGIHFVAMLRKVLGAVDLVDIRGSFMQGGVPTEVGVCASCRAVLPGVPGVSGVSGVGAEGGEGGGQSSGVSPSTGPSTGSSTGPVGTVHIQYGAFLAPVCRLDVYFEDAVLSVVQVGWLGYSSPHSVATLATVLLATIALYVALCVLCVMYDSVHIIYIYFLGPYYIFIFHGTNSSHLLPLSLSPPLSPPSPLSPLLSQHTREREYEVLMTGLDPQRFVFGGLEAEFGLWLDAIQERTGAGAGASGGCEAEDLTPEQGLVDLLVIEALCRRREGEE